jgi:hypothetical protein
MTATVGISIALTSACIVTIDSNDIGHGKLETSRAISWVPDFLNYRPNS